MNYSDLIFGFQSKAISLGYFKQFIYGYDDRLNSSMTKDVNENPNEYPILLIPPQNSELTRLKEERFRPFSISGHKRPKQEKGVSLTIASNVVTFTTAVFDAGDMVIFKDSRTNYEIPIKISTVVGTLATGTSRINLADGTIISTVEEDHAWIHSTLENNMMDIIDAVRDGFTDKAGVSVKPQAIDRSIRVLRLDQYGSRGYVRLIMDFNIDIKNCEL